MELKRYKIEVAYDGTSFSGWQQQDHVMTVQQCLQKKFYSMFGQKINIVAASRTDSGVHAQGQVAAFTFFDLKISAERLFKLWNDALPKDILIKNFQEVDLKFNPQFDVVKKIYSYDLFLKKANPLVAKFGWRYRQIDKINWSKFEEFLKIFVGKHNFESFCRIDPEAPKNPVRTVDNITVVFLEDSICRVTFQAKGFLRYQIRRMIGAALEYALPTKNFDLKNSQQALEGIKMPAGTVPTFCAEGEGLTLLQVIYLN
jgi:tRNA pseudouridine38-40 synthase